MDWNWLQKTLGEHLDRLVLWAKDDKRRFILFLIIAVFVIVVLLPRLFQLASSFDYIGLVTSIWIFIYTKSNTKEFSTIMFFAVLLLLFVVKQFLSHSLKRIFEIDIEKQPELWSYYKGSGWSIIEDATSWNKVLKLNNCTYPAILKFGNDWLNYNFSFEAKVPTDTEIKNPIFTFAVRAKDKGNCVFFQCRPDGTIRPHLITNGLFIVDEANELKFLAEFPTGKWIPVKVGVKGDNVSIFMLGVSANYKIPSTRLIIPGDKIRGTISLGEALRLTKENEPVEPEKSIGGNTTTTKLAFDLDYEKGTIGFRESGRETAMFRKIRVELIQPIYK